jgi:hypothetical protein
VGVAEVWTVEFITNHPGDSIVHYQIFPRMMDHMVPLGQHDKETDGARRTAVAATAVNGKSIETSGALVSADII